MCFRRCCWRSGECVSGRRERVTFWCSLRCWQASVQTSGQLFFTSVKPQIIVVKFSSERASERMFCDVISCVNLVLSSQDRTAAASAEGIQLIWYYVSNKGTHVRVNVLASELLCVSRESHICRLHFRWMKNRERRWALGSFWLL